MGFNGWAELRDFVTLVGTVDPATGTVLSGDRDWCVKVAPDAAHRNLLSSKPDVDHTNDNGLVECEVQPPDSVNNGNNAQSMWGVLVGQRVVVIGTWSIDQSHYSRGGGSIVFPWEYDKGKLEIHPITVLMADPDDNPASSPALAKQVQVWAVSDSADSSIFDPQRPSTCPHNKENRVLDFVIPFPPTPAGIPLDRWANWRTLSEDNQARGFSAHLMPAGQTGQWPAALGCHVETGTKNEGKGWYHAVLDIGQPAMFVSQSVPASMQAGQSYPVSITMHNYERHAWSSNSLFMTRLGSSSTAFGINRVDLPAVVQSNTDVTFNFTVTAPKTSGTYPFSWQMVFETAFGFFHASQWRGETTPVVNVVVSGGKGKESKESKETKEHKDGKEALGKEALIEKSQLRETERAAELIAGASFPSPDVTGASTGETAPGQAQVFIGANDRPAQDPQDPSRLLPPGTGTSS